MRYVPLFETPHQIEARSVTPECPTRSCMRCPRGARSKNPVFSPLRAVGTGDSGTLLLLAESPTRADDERGAPAEAGWLMRCAAQARANWRGDVVVDYAVRCAGSAKEDAKDEKLRDNAESCRPFLAHSLAAHNPTRVIAFGRGALYALIGDEAANIDPLTAMGGWFSTSGVLVYILPSIEHIAYSAALVSEFMLAFANSVTMVDPVRADMEGRQVAIVETVEDMLACEADMLCEPRHLVYDVETWGKLGDGMRVVAAGLLRVTAQTPFVVPHEALGNPDIVGILKRVLENRELGKVGHNIKFDINATDEALGIAIAGPVYDTANMSSILNAEAKQMRLETTGLLGGWGGYKSEFAKRWLDPIIEKLRHADKKLGIERPKKWKYDPYAYAFVEPTELIRYNARDLCATDALGAMQREVVRGETLRPLGRGEAARRVWSKLGGRSIYAFAQIERWGIEVNVPHVRAAQQQVSALIAEKQLILGPDVNVKSTEQIAHLLYGDPLEGGLGFNIDEFTDAGKPSTSKATIEKLLKSTPSETLQAVYAIRKYRDLMSKYLVPMPLFVRRSGRVHPTFRIAGTSTGRTSSADPNLYNIPRADEDRFDKDLGRCRQYVKDTFIATGAHDTPSYEAAGPDDYVLLQLDESQLELRIAAEISGDHAMRQVFVDKHDMHMMTATKLCTVVWGISREEWDRWTEEAIASKGKTDRRKPYRSMVKAIVFGLAYGKGDWSLAKELGITEDAASNIRLAIFGMYPQFAAYLTNMQSYARQNGGVWTFFGGEQMRWRPLPGATSGDKGRFGHAMRQAVNCLDAETEALTQRGWVRGFDLRDDDIILTKNAETNVLEWQAMTKLCLFPDYEGPLVEFKSKSFNAITTPDHRWLVTNKATGRNECVTTAKLSPHGDHRIHRTGLYRKAETEHTDAFIALVGWFLTDGFIHKPVMQGEHRLDGTVRNRRIGLCQSLRANPQKVAAIDKVINALQIKASRSVAASTECVTWTFSGLIAQKLYAMFPQRKLTMPFLLSLSYSQAQLLRDIMMLGDGTGHGFADNRKASFVTRDEDAAGLFQVLNVMCDTATSAAERDFSKYNDTRKTYASMANNPKSGTVWNINLLRRDKTQVVASQRREFTAKMPVWCPQVPNTYFVARRRGQVFVTGNTPIQGSASDYVLHALLDTIEWVQASRIDARVLVSVYDSIVLETRKRLVPEVVAKVRGFMENLPVETPLKADVEVGVRWGQMEKWNGA